jgi:hypothetical protein
MLNKTRNTLLSCGIALSLAQAAGAAPVACNSCSDVGYEVTAAAAGPGVHVVYDTANAQVTAWRAVLDRETRQMVAYPMELPDASVGAYLDNLQLAALGQANHSVVIRPGTTPLGGYNGFNAYDLVTSGTLRNSIGTLIANHWSGATTGSQSLNDNLTALRSLIQGGLIPGVTAFTRTVVIVWDDGSRSVFQIKPDTADIADYQEGQSTDANGNPIPEATTVGPGSTTFNGLEFTFRTDYDVERWVRQMRLLGVPVTGGQGRRIGCVRVGDGPLECHYF